MRKVKIRRGPGRPAIGQPRRRVFGFGVSDAEWAALRRIKGASARARQAVFEALGIGGR